MSPVYSVPLESFNRLINSDVRPHSQPNSRRRMPFSLICFRSASIGMEFRAYSWPFDKHKCSRQATRLLIDMADTVLNFWLSKQRPCLGVSIRDTEVYIEGYQIPEVACQAGKCIGSRMLRLAWPAAQSRESPSSFPNS